MLTDRQRLATLVAAEGLLKQTTRGYTPAGTFWRRAMPMIWTVRLSLLGRPDGDELARAHGILKKTEKGYDPRAPRWREAMEIIDWVEAGLAPPPVPYLGPVTRGGKPILLERLTHDTDGLYNRAGGSRSTFPDSQRWTPGSLYPAFDFGWIAGVTILAPEPWIVTEQSSAMGADACYLFGEDSGMKWWLGHIVRAPGNGVRFARGDRVAEIALIPGADHGHLGVDARPLVKRDLLYGENGRGPDYTYGSPAIGAQLTKGLAT